MASATRRSIGFALVLGLAQGLWANPAQPAAPGQPPSRKGWEYDLEVADRLFESGYLREAQEDYTKILTAYPDSVLGIDRAWLGLARVHQARGDTAQSRAAFEEVMRRERDPIASSEARTRYRALRAEAELEVNEARRATEYYLARYRATSWANPFGKIFRWFDQRKAKGDYEKAAANADSFNPRYLIDPVPAPPPGAMASTDPQGHQTFTLTPEEMAALLNGQATGTTGTAGGATLPVATVPATTPAASTVVPSATTPAASTNVEDLRTEYLRTYQELRAALATGDTARIQATTQAYQAAKTAYEAGVNRGATGS